MLPNALDEITAERKNTGGWLRSGASPYQSPIEDEDDDEYENDRVFARYLLDDAPDSTAKGRRDIASRTIFRT